MFLLSIYDKAIGCELWGGMNIDALIDITRDQGADQAGHPGDVSVAPSA